MANWGDTRIVEASETLFVLQILYYNHWHGLKLITEPGKGVVNGNFEHGTTQQLTECSYPKRELAEAAQEAYKEYKKIEEKLCYKEQEPAVVTPSEPGNSYKRPSSPGFFRWLFGYRNS